MKILEENHLKKVANLVYTGIMQKQHLYQEENAVAEFQELIKNFDRIRDYMRQFYIYGFKVRTDYDNKSARTYDNERRRIESWLAGYMESDYTAKGKQFYINVDSKTIPQNPLYAAWKSKSFTDNDMMLHFFILDLLYDQEEGMTAAQLTDACSVRYGVVFDSQTVRLKLKEYAALDILKSRKQGNALYYQLFPLLPQEADLDSAWKQLMTAVAYFQEAAPFGFIGSTILDRENLENELFQFKHHFIVHTLEDGVLSDILEAIHAQRAITFQNKSSRSGNIAIITGIPLKIFVSTRTGRRYLCISQADRRRFLNVRLDSMADVKLMDICRDYEKRQTQLANNLDRCWGVSFGGDSRLEEVCIKIYIDENRESYILDRLCRESRGGEVQKIREHEYLYSGAFFDTNELLSWVKTFTGRILDIQGSNQCAILKITRDWEKMYEMYHKPATENQRKEEMTYRGTV